MDARSQSLSIGIDLGGTKIQAALVTADATVLQDLRRPTNADSGADAAVEEITTMVSELRQKAESREVASVGIGVAGQVEADTGVVRGAPNLGWQDYPLQEKLKDATGLPVSVVNDVRAATFGEWRYGGGRGTNDLVCLFIGTGVGGGVVTGGELLAGANNSAGEMGHMTISLHGPQCRCRNHGCLEAYAGGWAIAQRAQTLVRADQRAGAKILQITEGQIDEITAEHVSEAFRQRDPLARDIIEVAVEALIAGCITIANALNPERIIFGGGVIEGVPELIEQIAQGVQKRALPSAVDHLRFLKAELGDNTGVIGAAALAREAADQKEGK